MYKMKIYGNCLAVVQPQISQYKRTVNSLTVGVASTDC